MQKAPRQRDHALARTLTFWTEERSLTVMLILLVLHLFVLTPGTFLGHAFRIVASLLLLLAMLAGFLALVRQRTLRWLGTFLVAGVISFRSAAFYGVAPWMTIGNILFTLLSLAALLYVVFRQVNQEGPVTAHRIRGAIALYLLIAMLFAFLYGLLEALAPGAFNIPAASTGLPVARGETFYYFSIVTLTTVGFGDITAVHPFVRSLVMLEALIGQLYPAILIARLVTLQLETRRSGK